MGGRTCAIGGKQVAGCTGCQLQPIRGLLAGYRWAVLFTVLPPVKFSQSSWIERREEAALFLRPLRTEIFRTPSRTADPRLSLASKVSWESKEVG